MACVKVSRQVRAVQFTGVSPSPSPTPQHRPAPRTPDVSCYRPPASPSLTLVPSPSEGHFQASTGLNIPADVPVAVGEGDLHLHLGPPGLIGLPGPRDLQNQP